MRLIKSKITKRRLVHLGVGVLALPLLAFGATSVFMELRAHATSGEYSWQKLNVGARDEGVGIHNKYSITVSSDGTKIAIIDYDGHIHTSNDSGETWTPRMDDKNRQWRSISGSEDGSKLVALDSGMMHISDDSGETWTTGAVAPASTSWRLVSSSADGSKIVATTNGAYGAVSLLTSDDHGHTWTERPAVGTSDWKDLAISLDGSKITVTSYSNVVHSSNDFGESWTMVSDNSAGSWDYFASSINGDKMIAANYNDYIYTSTDYGHTWTENTDLGIQNWRNLSIDREGNTATAITADGSVYISTDSGASWNGSGITPNHTYMYLVGAQEQNIIIVSSSGRLFYSNDKGESWTVNQITKKRYPSWSSFASSIDGVKHTAVAYNRMFTSNDSGVTWTERMGDGEIMSWTSVDSSDDGTKIVAVATNNYIYTSNDSGVTWTERMDDEIRQWKSVASNGDGTKLAALAGEYGQYTVYTSEDSGATWNGYDLGLESDVDPGIALNSSGSELAVIVESYVTGSKIYTSSDLGETWGEITPNGSLHQFSKILYGTDNLMTVYGISADISESGISASSALYTSTDGGATWRSQLEIDNAVVLSVATSPNGSRLLAGVLHDYQGSFEDRANIQISLQYSNDYGHTWTEKENPFGLMPLTMSSDGAQVLAGHWFDNVGPSPLYLGTLQGSTPDPSPTTPTLNLDDSAPTSTNPAAPQKITNKRPTFSGVAYPFAEITVTVNSDPIVCTTVADASGNWSCTLPSDVPAGVHSVVVQVTNPDTNEVEELGPYYIQAGETIDDETPVGGGSGAGGDPNTPNTGAEKRASANPALLTALAVLSVLSLAAVAKLRKQ